MLLFQSSGLVKKKRGDERGEQRTNEIKDVLKS